MKMKIALVMSLGLLASAPFVGLLLPGVAADEWPARMPKQAERPKGAALKTGHPPAPSPDSGAPRRERGATGAMTSGPGAPASSQAPSRPVSPLPSKILWENSLEIAKERARAEGKPILFHQLVGNLEKGGC
jgi:hypothetical protein